MKEKDLATLAWDIVHQFMLEWQEHPFQWEREVDIQAELASRLRTVLRLIGAHHLDSDVKRGSPEYAHSLYSRVACEPLLTFPSENGEQSECYPDIVLWANARNPAKPPNDRVWPVLWACEIKYAAKRPNGWDLEKLRHLIRTGTLAFGCWIDIARRRAPVGDGLRWIKSGDERLWRFEVFLPERAPEL